MDSANVNEKNQKMDFLEKIIKVVGLQLNTLVAANPAKIVAGRDAQDTNNFLQLLAVAARHMPDSRNSVRIVMEQYGGMTAAAGGAGGGGNPPSEQPSMPAQKQQIATTATPIQQPISSAVPSAETKAKGHDSKESSREQSNRELIREQPPMTSKETPRDPPSSMNDQMIADEKITVSDTLSLSLCLYLSAYSRFVAITYIRYGDRDHQSFSFILSYPQSFIVSMITNCICIIIVYRE
jgi:hypothetical protein